MVADPHAKAYNDTGTFIPLPLVNTIRRRVKEWHNNGYPGVSSVTKQLLEHWNNPEMRQYPFFFCQLDAIETLIWLIESPETERAGIVIPGDGGAFKRICTKLCTGGGKTTVMAMLIAWNICNKVAYPRDTRFSKNIFVVAPGLTVKSRLQVLKTGGQDNYYDQFKIVPNSLTDKLNQGNVRIVNWQMLAWDSEEDIAKKKSSSDSLGDTTSLTNVSIASRVLPPFPIKRGFSSDVITYLISLLCFFLISTIALIPRPSRIDLRYSRPNIG